ncbi:cell wall-active antibiotics response protein [Massilia sp. H6]|uniref:cell wall-active antibiotics response protein n=1 Tax=Massilia sp. H6 TaxID=2970464 RepID=UPI00216965E6|nr:cell wall-active antibiotics response protein [Massilia sp. H6]UVW30318.1 cell wall-active antibiotics response protein [Massilia sp. H6]
MQNKLRAKGVTSQVVLGLLVILVGLLFLLDNLDIIDTRSAISFWPMLFLIVGTVKLCDTQTLGGQLTGTGLIALGVILMLDRMNIIDFNWRVLWPLLFIGFGVYTLFKAHIGRRQLSLAEVKDQTDAGGESVVDVTAILGAFERRVVTPNFRGGEITAVMGGCALDLRHSSIQGEAVVNVFAVWGGVTLKVPPDWTVILDGTPIMGGFEEKTIAPPDNSKRLLVRGYAIMGGVEVRN